MDRDEQNRIACVEDVAGAVPVVDVPVEDQHALDPEVIKRVLGSHRDVVEQAEAHRPGLGGVVTRRAVGAESDRRIATEQELRHPHRPAGCVQRSLERASAHHRVEIKLAAAARRHGLDCPDVRQRVNRGQRRAVGRRRLQPRETKPIPRRKLMRDRGDPRRLLGVRTGLMRQRGRMFEKDGLTSHRQYRTWP